MAEFDDGFDSYYANRLWQLLPGVYRAQDSVQDGVDGPLRELVARVGAQAAAVRRSLDRLWADQSIETCDDWAIPFIGDLLGTNLLAHLDAAGRRLDVAKTIHYRRRKGTVAVLEELARDITGWQAHVVEGYRGLCRTRHSLDPPIGSAAPGAGFADLRSVHGAGLAGSPFDDLAYTADLRAGRGAAGRHAIGRLLVFVWRLLALPVAGATPVAVSGCTGLYTFDPTGRRVPLFMSPPPPESETTTGSWSPLQEWQVPGPLSPSLQAPVAFAGAAAGTPLEPVDIVAFPLSGEFQTAAPSPSGMLVSYRYGFPAMLGAGPYDRSLLAAPPQPSGTVTSVSGGAGLDATLGAAAGSGTVLIEDSQTYVAVVDPGSTSAPIGSLLIQAGPLQRPVVRLPAPAGAGDPAVAWSFTGGGGEAASRQGLPSLTLDGLLVSGGDVVLRGAFAHVRLTGMTLDPGTAGTGSGAYATTADGRPLAPVTLWIEADPDAGAGPNAIELLEIESSVLGPIRTRSGGAVETLAISDSIVQAVPAAAPAPSTPPPAAIALDAGTVTLARVTVIGALAVHRLAADDCILAGPVTVQDAQAGALRHCAAPTGSVTPRQFSCAQTAPGGSLFASAAFGAPAYAQLLETVDRAIVAAPEGVSISAGAANGAEMGAYSAGLAAVRESGLLIKCGEYMPLGLAPVVVHVT